MMLSRLTLNLEARVARRDFGDPYQMHSSLMRLMANGEERPLWRVERTETGRPPIVLLQTDNEPNWSALGEIGEQYLLDHECQENRLVERLRVDDKLNFRLRANPTVTREGKRHGLVQAEDQIGWLQRQLSNSGASLGVVVPTGVTRESFRKRRGSVPITLSAVTFDGTLQVIDPVKLSEAVRRGFGHGKSFGLGLLTLAR